jgi:uncharacterized protein (DUF1697 family)
MYYVALLRGINVGGNAKVEMPRLKRVFESLGAQNVRTYINSGNVIFSDGRAAEELVQLIERAIEQEFKLQVPVVLRSKAEIDNLCASIPPEWTNDAAQKTDVMFLWDEIADEGILDKISINPEIENVRYCERALVWNIPRQFVTRGGGVKLIKTDYYRHMTVRNINTVRKLNQLLADV